MKNSNAPCQKSVVDIERTLDQEPILSPSFSETISDSSKILFIIEKDSPKSVVDVLLSKAADKPFTIVTPFEKENEPSYDFFGITKGHTPVLINKAFLEHDTVVVVSTIKYDGLFGFSGGKSLLFPGIGAEKSLKSLILKHALNQQTFYKNSTCAHGITKNNPLESEVLDAVMIIRQNAFFFGVNIVPDNCGGIADIFCGDLFMSHIKGAEKFAEMYPLPLEPKADGVILELKDGSLQSNVELIEQACRYLKKGGRLFIKGNGLKSFGSDNFKEAFFMGKREEIFSALVKDFSLDLFQAIILKYACENYHIALSSVLDEDAVRQVGLNPMNETDVAEFLKNCCVLEDVYNAGGFTSIK